MSASPEAEGDLNRFKKILIEAGEIVTRFHESEDKDRKVDNKGAGLIFKEWDPVTEADLQVNDLLRKRLTALKPNALWVSEESVEELDQQERLSSEEIWLVDPIDGTRELVNRVPEVGVSVALIRGEKAVWGGVYNPLSGDGGLAIEGESHFWGWDENSKSSDVIVSRSEWKRGDLDYYRKQCQGQFELRVVGSVAYKMLRVAAGMDAATFTVRPKNEWDIAGACALLEAQGLSYERKDGQVLKFNQQDMVMKSAAACGEPQVVKDLIKAMNQDFKPAAKG